jgi:hypothetical protein
MVPCCAIVRLFVTLDIPESQNPSARSLNLIFLLRRCDCPRPTTTDSRDSDYAFPALEPIDLT